MLANLAELHQALDELARRQTRIRIGLAELGHLVGGLAGDVPAPARAPNQAQAGGKP